MLTQEAGLLLPDRYFLELLAAYTNARRMIDRLPTSHPRADEIAATAKVELPIQHLIWPRNVLSGDFGTSIMTQRPRR